MCTRVGCVAAFRSPACRARLQPLRRLLIRHLLLVNIALQGCILGLLAGWEFIKEGNSLFARMTLLFFALVFQVCGHD